MFSSFLLEADFGLVVTVERTDLQSMKISYLRRAVALTYGDSSTRQRRLSIVYLHNYNANAQASKQSKRTNTADKTTVTA